MKRLAGAHEHLDGPLVERDVLAGNLRDLRRINRLFGGVALSRRAVDALVARPDGERGTNAGEAVTLLDVGTGGADIPLALIGAWRRRGRQLTVIAIDSRPEVLEAALAERSAIGGEAGLQLQVADGRRLPFDDDAFDVAHTSLVLHHMEPPDAVALLEEMARVSRRGVVVNDLERGLLPWLGAWLVLHLVTRNAFTLHDGPLSVRRAYSAAEARELLQSAGLRPVHGASAIAGHRWAIAAVRA